MTTLSSSGPTPGPWSVNPLTARVDCAVLDEDGDPLPICELLWPTDYRSEDETFANGRLIAAALELLEALEETWCVLRAAGLLNLTNGVQLGQTSWYVKACDAEKLSNAAIAKATGA